MKRYLNYNERSELYFQIVADNSDVTQLTAYNPELEAGGQAVLKAIRILKASGFSAVAFDVLTVALGYVRN